MAHRVLFFCLFLCWISRHTAWANEAKVKQTKQSRGFFAKPRGLPIRLGVKINGKTTVDTINQLASNVVPPVYQPGSALGGSFAAGPFVEWKFLQGMGLQTGLFYARHYLGSFSLHLNNCAISTTSLPAFAAHARAVLRDLFQSKNINKQALKASIDPISLHAVHIPLHVRLYPEATRQLVLYGGGCVVVVVGGVRQRAPFHCTVNLEDLKYALSARRLHTGFKNIFAVPPERLRDTPLHIPGTRVQWKWDFGFEFHGKTGIVLGLYKLGLCCGYDCTNWLLRTFDRAQPTAEL